jgi:hypothetical protein
VIPETRTLLVMAGGVIACTCLIMRFGPRTHWMFLWLAGTGMLFSFPTWPTTPQDWGHAVAWLGLTFAAFTAPEKRR